MAELQRKTVKIGDLKALGAKVAINDEQEIDVRPLNLAEMVALFIDSRDDFLPLYSAGLEGFSAEKMMPFLLTAPNLVARIIAMACDSGDAAGIEAVRKFPATVQLVALVEIWKLSVPDAKKAQELLSQVTALLEDVNKRNELATQQIMPQTSGQLVSVNP